MSTTGDLKDKSAVAATAVESDSLEVGSAKDFIVSTNAEDFQDKYDPIHNGAVKRGLTQRHVSLIIIGSSIGTALFIGVYTPLMRAGSLPLFLGFVIYAFTVMYVLMQCVAEMCSWLPIPGSMFHFAARFVDPALGFASGWMYLYGAMMFVCVEMVAAAGVVGYWTDINPGAWITIFIALSVFMNFLAVRFYGETEFCSSMLKVFLIVGLMIFAFISMLGGNPNHDRYGFRNWKDGLWKEYLVEGNTGKFLAFWSVLIYAAFAVGGPDVLMMISGETKNPRKNIAIAGRKSYIRIYLFYLGGIFFMNTLCSANNATLIASVGGSGAASSPWVIGIKETAGVKGLDNLVNAIIMTSAWSCGNGYLYSSSRTLYSLSLAGYAPRIFSKCSKRGTPYYAVLVISLICCISFLSVSNGSAVAFNWFANLATSALLCTYIIIFVVYLQWRRAMIAQGFGMKAAYYTAPFKMQPYATYFGLFFSILILFFNGFSIFFPGEFSASGFFTAYFAPIFFIFLFVFWKVYKKTHLRSPLEADITTGKDIIDREDEAIPPEPEVKGWRKVRKLFYNICY